MLKLMEDRGFGASRASVGCVVGFGLCQRVLIYVQKFRRLEL